MGGEREPPDAMGHAARSSVGATAAQAGYEYQLDVSVLGIPPVRAAFLWSR